MRCTGSGVLRLEVHEAQVTRVILYGDTGRYRDALEEIGARLEAARPLRKDDMPEALRAMRRIAGLSVNVNTRRDAQVRNGFELLVQADFSAGRGMVRMNNRGTDAGGTRVPDGSVVPQRPGGREEKLGLIFAARQRPVGIPRRRPVLRHGAGPGRHARQRSCCSARIRRPTRRPVNYADEYLRERASLRVSHPLRQDSDCSLNLDAALRSRRSHHQCRRAELRDERLRIMEAGCAPAGAATAATSTRRTCSCARDSTRWARACRRRTCVDDPRSADFLLTQLSATVYRRFATDWSLRLDGFAQYTSDVLPDSRALQDRRRPSRPRLRSRGNRR